MAILIDGHVHIYPSFSLSCFFDTAWNNFSKISAAQGVSGEQDYALFLTEGGENDVYEKLCKRADSDESVSSNTFRFQRTEEAECLLAERDGCCMYVFAGRQYVSSENIELLSLFSRKRITDKSLTLSELAQAVTDAGGIVVVPWGVGKWFGKRGVTIRNYFDLPHTYPVFAGDNGNRPFFWPSPTLFLDAQKNGVKLLSGSDPLPLAMHYDRVATSGTIIANGEISKNLPVTSLRQQLKSGKEMREFGKRLSSGRFFFDQFRMNVFRR